MLKAWVFANTRQQVEGVKDLLSDSLLKIWVFANTNTTQHAKNVGVC